MPAKSHDEVLAYAKGVYKLMRARKHLANRGAEKDCIRLLGSVIKRAEREFFKPASSVLPNGAPDVDSRGRKRQVDSTRLLSERNT